MIKKVFMYVSLIMKQKFINNCLDFHCYGESLWRSLTLVKNVHGWFGIQITNKHLFSFFLYEAHIKDTISNELNITGE